MTSLPAKSENVVYHILQNGSDTSDCGSSVDSACFSLLYVLMLYYAQHPKLVLEIRTDVSLKIDEKFMVRHFSILFLNLCADTFAENFLLVSCPCKTDSTVCNNSISYKMSFSKQMSLLAQTFFTTASLRLKFFIFIVSRWCVSP